MLRIEQELVNLAKDNMYVLDLFLNFKFLMYSFNQSYQQKFNLMN